MRFKYSTTSPTQNEFDSLPRIPLILQKDNQNIEVTGLVDSGAPVNVLPYEIVEDEIFQWAYPCAVDRAGRCPCTTLASGERL